MITVGIAGLGSYLMFVISNIINSLRLNKNNPFLIAIVFGIICYSIQAFVNLNLPITTPVFWLLIGMSASKKVEVKD